MQKDLFEQFNFITKRDIKFVRSITAVFDKEKQSKIEIRYARILRKLTKNLQEFERVSCIATANTWLRSQHESEVNKIKQQKRLQLTKVIKARYEKQIEALVANYRNDIKKALVTKFHSFENVSDALKFIKQFNEKHSDFKFYDYNDRDITRLAKQAAERCREIAYHTNFFPLTIEKAVEQMHKHAEKLHIQRATATNNDFFVTISKYTDEIWWRPRLRRIIRRKREELAVECGLVSKQASHYSSKLTQEERKQQLERNKNWSEKTTLVCDDIKLNMSDLIKSKEKCYQAELVTMIAGLRDLQDKNKFAAAMITVTCPAAFRRNGTTPAASADHLRKVWARVRAKAKRENLFVAGMQVWQPHKDAIAHQHIYCIGGRSQLERFAEIVKAYSLKLYSNERGAQEHRCDIMFEDKSRGRLSSYAARYVTRLAKKSDDETCATDTTTPEDAWYAAHNIRRVSFFGLPPKKLWRYFRKASRKICNTKQMKQIRKAARAGKYADFCSALTWKGIKKELEYKTLYKECKNRYQETTKKEVGITFKGINIFKKIKKWVFEVSSRILPHNCPSAADSGIKKPLSGMFEQCKHLEQVLILA